MERVGLKQTQLEAVELLHSLFGGYRSIHKPTAKKGKPLHSILLGSSKACIFVEAILPYLRIKKTTSHVVIRA